MTAGPLGLKASIIHPAGFRIDGMTVKPLDATVYVVETCLTRRVPGYLRPGDRSTEAEALCRRFGHFVELERTNAAALHRVDGAEDEEQHGEGCGELERGTGRERRALAVRELVGEEHERHEGDGRQRLEVGRQVAARERH